MKGGTPITPAQIRKIQTMRRRAGIEEEDWRLLLWNVAGVRSCRDLTGWRVEAVMEHLRRCLGEVPPVPQAPPRGGGGAARERPGPALLKATPGQIDLILELWGGVTRVPPERPRERLMALRNWLRRTVRVNHENFLSRAQAQAAIEGLKRMAGRDEKAQTG